MKRLEGLESNGFTILYGPRDIPFYSNMIQGLIDSFRNRNTRLNLLVLGLHVDIGCPGLHGGYGEEGFVHSPVDNGLGNSVHGNDNSTDTEPEYFPATDYLSSEEDY